MAILGLRSKKAFTLIELLIVIAIILVMAVTAIPLYQNYGANQSVVLKAEEIQAMLDRAYAYSQNPAQGKNCAHVFKNENIIKIQFGSIDQNKFSDTDGCVVANEEDQIVSSKDEIQTDGFNVQFGTPAKPIDRFFAFYPGVTKLYSNNSGVDNYYLVDSIVVSAPEKTDWKATIRINTLLYSSSLDIYKPE